MVSVLLELLICFWDSLFFHFNLIVYLPPSHIHQPMSWYTGLAYKSKMIKHNENNFLVETGAKIYKKSPSITKEEMKLVKRKKKVCFKPNLESIFL